MAKQKENAVVHSQEQLADGIYSMWINTEAAKDAKPYEEGKKVYLHRILELKQMDCERNRWKTQSFPRPNSVSGCFDVDDILLNTIGGVLGYIVFVVCNLLRRRNDRKKRKEKR